MQNFSENRRYKNGPLDLTRNIARLNKRIAQGEIIRNKSKIETKGAVLNYDIIDIKTGVDEGGTGS
jgi:hypothetical protein